MAKVAALPPEFNLAVSYNQIPPGPILKTAPLGFINFHAGKLPYCRGRNVTNWAIINGEREIGLTAHYIDRGIDTGDIILQRAVSMAWKDAYRDVPDKALMAFPNLVADTSAWLPPARWSGRSKSWASITQKLNPILCPGVRLLFAPWPAIVARRSVSSMLRHSRWSVS